MKREIIVEGPTVEDALDSALSELGVQQDAVAFEILEEGGKKLFGLGTDRAARVRVWLRDEFIAEMTERETENGSSEGANDTDVAIDSIDDQVPAAVLRDAVGTLSDDELDRVADEAVNVIQTVLDAFGIDAKIEEYEGDEGEIILDIVGGDLGLLIGRHGRTLDSMQVLVSAITNRKLGFRYPVLVDVEGYRNRRREKLEEIASRAAERVARQGAPVKLRPMSALERRVVHMCLRDDARVATASDGEDPFRAVVISPRRR